MLTEMVNMINILPAEYKHVSIVTVSMLACLVTLAFSSKMATASQSWHGCRLLAVRNCALISEEVMVEG